jgi:ketosteroid isomerase-like protein
VATLPDSFTEHPARDASHRSMLAVERGDRDGWLSLFSEDAVVEDPIGPSPFDPGGEGHRGREAIGAFYDAVISPTTVRFRIDESYAAGLECANIGCITTTLADGSVVETNGVFTYRVDTEGSIAALRAYWEMDRLVFQPASVT